MLAGRDMAVLKHLLFGTVGVGGFVSGLLGAYLAVLCHQASAAEVVFSQLCDLSNVELHKCLVLAVCE